MKKTLLFLLFSQMFFAQHPDLVTNDWYVSQIEWSGQTIVRPVSDHTLQPSQFTPSGNGQYQFYSKYFNTSAANDVTFVSTDTFTTANGFSCTLQYYFGNNYVAVNDFDDKHCQILGGSTTHPYQIINNGTNKTLIISNPNNGNKVYYNNYYLSNREAEMKPGFRIFPNPALEEIHIENVEKNKKVQIFDLSGKLLESSMSKEKMSINIQHFPKGQYLLQIESYPSQFILKE